MRISNQRYANKPPGGLYLLGVMANELEAEGKTLIHMEIGQPDFDSPAAAKDGAKQALDEGKVSYTDTAGILPLRQAISEKETTKGHHYDPIHEIVVTSGASEALSAIFLTMLEPGEEVLCLSPYYADYPEIINLSGGKIKEVPVELHDRWVVNTELLEKSLSEKTKLILINNPNNPCGYNLSRENLEAIAAFAIKNDLPVISDECYEELVYSGAHLSIALLPGMRARTLVVKSMSKTYSMTGWRLGYAMGPAPLANNVLNGHYAISTSSANFPQWGALDAVRHGSAFTAELVAEFKRRNEYMYERLKAVPGVRIAKPEGSMFLFPDISAFGLEDKAFCEYLMKEAGVVAAPGSIFGAAGIGHIRLAYCVPFDQIVQATDAIIIALGKLKLQQQPDEGKAAGRTDKQP